MYMACTQGGRVVYPYPGYQGGHIGRRGYLPRVPGRAYRGGYIHQEGAWEAKGGVYTHQEGCLGG